MTDNTVVKSKNEVAETQAPKVATEDARINTNKLTKKASKQNAKETKNKTRTHFVHTTLYLDDEAPPAENQKHNQKHNQNTHQKPKAKPNTKQQARIVKQLHVSQNDETVLEPTTEN